MKKMVLLVACLVVSVCSVFADAEYSVGVKADGCSESTDFTVPSGIEITVEAVPDKGHHFTQWQDGNTSNPRKVGVNADVEYVASFAPDVHNITVETSDAERGSVSGGGSYDYGTDIQISATPNYGYQFKEWNDGDKQNPRTISVAGDKAYTALFAAVDFDVTVKSDGCEDSTVFSMPYETAITIEAVPFEGYHFKTWNDGSTKNPRKITVTADVKYVSSFEIDTHTLTLKASDNAKGTVSGGGIYDYDTPVAIAATPNYGYEFVRWSDGNTQSSRTVNLKSDSTLTATFTESEFVIIAQANVTTYGIIAGGGAYKYKTTATLTATPNEKFEFVCWEDGFTERTRQIYVVRDTLFTAIFRPYPTITLTANNSTMGVCTGGGQYATNSTRVIKATANAECEFVQWNDGDTNNPRTIVLEKDTTFTAEFRLQPKVTLAANNASMGKLSGGGAYPTNSSATIRATANQDYEFVQWNDGNTANPRIVIVSSDTSFVAEFRKQPLLTVTSNNNAMGGASGGGYYLTNTNVTLQANAKSGYEFVQWSDGVTNNPRTLKLTKDTAVVAVFRMQPVLVVNVNNTAMGTVSGAGQYNTNTSVTLRATAVSGFEFVNWNDGSVANPRTIVLEKDTVFTAIFRIKPTLSVTSNSTAMGTVSGDGQYNTGTTVQIKAVANTNYEFVEWNDGVRVNPRSIKIMCDTAFVAVFRQQPKVMLNANSTIMGTVSGAGYYKTGSSAIISAAPKTKYEFVKWNDGNLNAQRTIIVNHDTVFTAHFRPQPRLTLNASNNVMGIVTGGGQFPTGTRVEMAANANEGYRFVQWNDGVTVNPRNVILSHDTVFTAEFVEKEYTISAVTNYNGYGSVSGGGIYKYKTKVTLVASATEGYEFAQWNNGSNANPYIVTVLQDAVYTALFRPQPTVIVNANSSVMGTVSGAGQYPTNTEITIAAMSKNGYEFVRWDDGVTANPRTLRVTRDSIFTAIFRSQPTLSVSVNNASWGSVSDGGQFATGTAIDLVATPNAGYEFAQWNDGSVQNPRKITLLSDAVYVANFRAQPIVTVDVNDPSFGEVAGGGQFETGSIITLTATPNTDYEFVSWDDNDTRNPRTIRVSGDASYTAMFRSKPIITVKTNNADMGTVNGGGQYATNTYVRLEATPNYGYYFDSWSDGSVTNPRMIMVSGNATYEAVFKGLPCTIGVEANFDIMGIVDGAGVFEYGSIIALVAVPTNNCYFESWSDGSTENPHYVKVIGNQNYVANFAVGTQREETHGATVKNDGVAVTPFETKAEFTWPSITGVASYSLIIWADEAQGKKVCTLTFNANGQLTNIDFTQSVKPKGSASVEGLNFTVTGLEPGTTYGYTLDAKDAEDDVIETKHGTFTTMGASGIADITAAGINIYTEGRTIIVENAAEAITVSDALGRVVGKDDAHIIPAEIRKFPVPSSGVYVVKIGNRAASVLVR